MATRDREPDHGGGLRGPDRDEYPLLFKGDAPDSGRGILARILARVRAFFRTPDAEPDAEPEPETDPATGRLTRTDPVSDPVTEPFTLPVAGPPESVPDRTHAAAGGTRPSTGPLHRATLQILPGRLVPAHPDVLRQEIRFLRPSNPEREVTLGRARNDPPDHITIDHPSIERLHATMRYDRGHWWIESGSADRPVLLNGQVIGPEGGARHLKDGDRVRLGDIDFDFRTT